MGRTEDGYKYYAVTKGRNPGIYDNWVLAEKQVRNYSGNVFKGFQTMKGAENCMKTARIVNVKYFITSVDTVASHTPTEQSTGACNNPNDNNNSEPSADSDWSTLEYTSPTKHTPTLPNKTSTPKVNSSNHTRAGDEYCNKCSTLQELVNTLSSKLELAVDKLQAVDNKLEQALTHIDEMEAKFEEIKLSQKQVESTIGPKIGGALTRIQTLEATLDSHNSRKQADNQTWASTAANNNTTHVIQQSSTKGKLQSKTDKLPKTMNNRITFEPLKCAVIYDIETPAKGDDEIRRAVGRCVPKACIERIIRTGERAPKYIIQFLRAEMAQKVIEAWDIRSLGSSKIRAPTKEPPQTPIIGFAKHVPIDIEEHDIANSLTKSFPEATSHRLTKNGSKLRTLKITFRTETQLTEAINHGLLLEKESLCVRIEKANNSPVFTQCFKCWRFGHIAKFCQSTPVCKTCSNEHEQNPCTNDPKCRNCGENHPADSWSKCAKFQAYKDRTVNKHQRHGNGGPN